MLLNLQVGDFICISDNAYTREQVLAMEKSILGKLEWYLTVPTPYVFLVRYIKASVLSDKEVTLYAQDLLELCRFSYIYKLINYLTDIDGEHGVFPG